MTDPDALRPAELAARLQTLCPGQTRFLCAVSGGPDSMALVHALAQCNGLTVRAMHVDHGLHPDAPDWAGRVRAFCKSLDVPCAVACVNVPAGANVEARARTARYAALAAELAPGETLVTGHHRDDQALTLLLQLLRGAGPAGLAAMPARAPLGAGWHVRPLLSVGGDALRAYCQAHGIETLHDPANDDERFDRNYLQRRVVPVLAARWPAFAQTLSRSAAHCAEATGLLDALARLDAGAPPDSASLAIAPLRALGVARACNAVRGFLRAQGVPAPNRVRLREFVRQLMEAADDRLPALAYDGYEWRVYRDRLYRVEQAKPGAWRGCLRPAVALVLPESLGTLIWTDVDGAPALDVTFRQGGERFGAAPRRELKTFFQERGVLPWLRASAPLVWRGEDIVAIGGLWQDAALPGCIEWHDGPALLAS